MPQPWKYRPVPASDPDRSDHALSYRSIFTYKGDQSSDGTANGNGPQEHDVKYGDPYHASYFKSPFTYGGDGGRKGVKNGGNFKGGSYYTYSGQPAFATEHDVDAGGKGGRTAKIFETFVVLGSYVVAILTFPFSLAFCLKFVQNFERMVIFRLGRLQNAKGPGLILVLPCIDHVERVDMRSKSFKVEPIQILTADSGIVHVGCAIHYGVRDPVVTVKEVQNAERAIQNLVQSVLHCAVNRRPVTAIVENRKQFLEEFTDELAKASFPWGLEITTVDLLEMKLLKEANPPFAGVFKSLMPTLGNVVTNVAKSMHDNGNADANNPLAKLSEVFRQVQQSPECRDMLGNVRLANTDGLFQGLFGGGNMNQAATVPEETLIDIRTEDDEGESLFDTVPQNGMTDEEMKGKLLDKSVVNTAVMLDRLIALVSPVLGPGLVKSVDASYTFQIEETGCLYLDLKNGNGSIHKISSSTETSDDSNATIWLPPDLLVRIMAGQTSPLEAYMAGNISVEGDRLAAARLKNLGTAVSEYYQKREA